MNMIPMPLLVLMAGASFGSPIAVRPRQHVHAKDSTPSATCAVAEALLDWSGKPARHRAKRTAALGMLQRLS